MQDYTVDIISTLIFETVEASNAIEALEFILVENPLPDKNRKYIAEVSSEAGYTIIFNVKASN